MKAPRLPRLRRWLLRLVVAMVAARLLLALLLPWIVDFAAGRFGLSVDYRSASLSLLGLSLRFEDLAARATADPAAPMLLSAQDVTIDASMLQLLRGSLVVVDAAVGGGRIHVQRQANGALRLPPQWLVDGPTVQPDPAVDDTPLSFRLPVQIMSARLHDLRITYEDLQASPTVLAELAIDFAARDIGRTDAEGSLQLRLHSPQSFDDLWLQASTTTTEDQFAIDWQAAVRGMAPDSLPLPLDVRAMLQHVHALGLDARGTLRAHRDGERPRQAITSGDLHVTLTTDGTPLVSVDVTADESQTTASGRELPFTLMVRGREIVDSLRVPDGRLVLADERSSLAMNLQCRGLSLRFFRSWLEARGCTLPAAGIDATSAVHVEFGATADGTSLSATVTGLAIGTDDERLAWNRIALRDLRTTAAGVAIGALEVDGPDVAITALPDGRLAFAGIGLHAPAVATSPTPVPVTPVATATPFAWPIVTLRHLDWRGLALRFTDATLPAPATVHLTEATLVGDNLGIGRAQPPGQLVGTCMLPDAIGGLRAEIQLQPEARALAVDLQLTAMDVTLRAFTPWLQRAGITPVLQNGRLQAQVAGRLAGAGDGASANVRLANVRCEDDAELLLGVRSCAGTDLRISPQTLDLGTWTATDPYLAVRQNADTSVTLLGLRFGPAAPAAAATAATSTPPPTSPPTSPPTTTPTPNTTPPTAVAPTERTPVVLRHGPVTVQRGIVHLLAAGGQDAHNLSLGIDVTLGSDAGEGRPVPHEVTLHLDEAIESLQLRGTLQRTPSQLRLDTHVVGKGIQGPGFRSLLPASLQCSLHDGALQGHLLAELSSGPTPGVKTGPSLGLTLQARDLQLFDRGQEVCAVDSFRLDMPQIDADYVHIANVAAKGVRAVTASTPAGLLVPGLLVGASTPPATLVATPPTPTAADASGPSPSPSPSLPTGPSNGPTTAFVLPALRIDAIDLELERLVWQERRTADGQPIMASGRLRLAAPWATADDPEETPAAQFVATARIDPLCGEVRIEANVAPFASEPVIDLTVQAQGIDTTALTQVVPSLADRIEGTTTNADFSCRVHAGLQLRRRSVLLFDFGNPFGGAFALEDVRLAEAGKEPLLTVDLIEVVARSFDPRTGDLLLRAFDIDSPVLRAERTAAGLELLGLRLLPPPPATTEPVPPTPAVADASAAARTATSVTTAREFVLDRLRIHGLGLNFSDHTTTPSTHLPLQDVELVVQGVSSRATTEPRPIGFSLQASGGLVALEQRVLRSSMIAGLLGSAAEAVTGGKDMHRIEQRPFLDELRVTGQVSLSPQLRGQVRTLVRGLELPALRGLAKTGGVDLADGLMDLVVDTDLRGAEGVRIGSRTTFTWLSVTEPPGGPISTYLRLPAPLDSVLFLLRNDADEHVVPVTIDVPADGADNGAIASAAVEAVARVLADAVASAAFRAAGTLTGAVGLTGAAAALPTTTLSFAAGECLPDAGSLDEVLEAVADDPALGILLTHELGGGDLRRAADLANPPPAVVAESLTHLRAERAALADQRDRLATDVAALLAAGRMQDARTRHAELAVVDLDLGNLELTLDRALRMQAGEQERAIRRRTQEAAIAVASRRLETVRQMLVARLGPDQAARIEGRKPRAVEAADTPAGGRVTIVVRRRPLP